LRGGASGRRSRAEDGKGQEKEKEKSLEKGSRGGHDKAELTAESTAERLRSDLDVPRASYPRKWEGKAEKGELLQREMPPFAEIVATPSAGASEGTLSVRKYPGK
jgi:hypothetical protein